MKVWVKMAEREDMFQVELKEGDKVEALQFKVQDVTTVHASQQRLMFEGRLLDGSRPLSAYAIKEGSIINAALAMRFD